MSQTAGRILIVDDCVQARQELAASMGRLVANDADSYRYLAESIRKHPDQAALKTMLEQVGFASVGVRNLSAGIVAMHRGYRI